MELPAAQHALPRGQPFPCARRHGSHGAVLSGTGPSAGACRHHSTGLRARSTVWVVPGQRRPPRGDARRHGAASDDGLDVENLNRLPALPLSAKEIVATVELRWYPAGMSELAEARKALADCVRRHTDELTEQAIDEHRARGSGYAKLPTEVLRAVTLKGYGAIVMDIEGDAPHHFGDLFVRAMEGRLRQDFRAQDMRLVINIAQRSLTHLCHREYADVAPRLAAIERCHAVLEVTQDMMFAAFAAAQEAFVRAQFDIVDRLSAPMIPIYPGILLVPLIGPIDARRAEQIMDAMLAAIGRERGDVVLLDITGVPAIDPGVAGLLARASQAARLLGARVAIVGIRPAIAQTMVAGAVDVGGAITLANLQAGLEYALSQRGLAIQAAGAMATASRGGARLP